MKILIAIDGSEHSKQAVQEIAARPWPSGSEVRIIHAVESPLPALPDTMGVGAEFAREQFDRSAASGKEALEAAAALVREGGNVENVTTSIVASPYLHSTAQTIVDDAVSFGADLVVVGSRGRSAWKRIVLGSVSSAVAQHAHCSVEIARPRQSGK
jgi:nucleotide-binding universal stress UspA family protein